MTGPASSAPRLFGRRSWAEARRIADILRKETIGGALLLVGAALAMAWANSPWSAAYEQMRSYTVGPAWLHLNLDLATWAADGLLAIFFFVAGLELKREFVAGDLRQPRRAAVPIAAALGGVIVPAALYLLITRNIQGAAAGWAIPTATDIAFALAVLAVIGRFLPAALRTFLLTLAVVDDLLAIVIIALFYTSDLAPIPLLAALVPLAIFTVLVQRRIRSWWLLLPLAVTVWALVHASGVHATVAGVLLGFAVPVMRSRRAGGPEAGPGLAEHFEHLFRPLSAGVAVPLFAFLSAGVHLGGLNGAVTALSDPLAVGIVVGLVVGKPIGIMAATWLVARFTRAHLDEGLNWVDVLGLSILAGIGFTVSLLIGELAFGTGGERGDYVKMAVLSGSVTAALLASVILRLRNRAYRRLHEAETADQDRDSIPDVYQDRDRARPADDSVGDRTDDRDRIQRAAHTRVDRARQRRRDRPA
ncbi:Na+/H+ antiporter NhaA [Nonomuraea sp. SYSU D8015]|uniref:Na+/H+ antiporter NhaA n=1 Tax=Nonomuraea sp. SYSU D8015 TaxID=2593644 RepID=UPI0016603DD5|nr:Na+/H+ antiporter NhaA [Nonomuraea sp. SYSU D8015]